MTFVVTTRRLLLRGAASLVVAPWFVRAVAAADLPRFALGIASGQPRADGMVLWTRLTGADLPERLPVRWEIAADEQFRRVVARGEESAEADWAHSVHAEPAGLEPGRWYWYRFSALGQQSSVGRTRTA
ncbi:MAG: PhoD-like phosphatase N-terminal domain-containing protein, partial [Caldimonas sp.]